MSLKIKKFNILVYIALVFVNIYYGLNITTINLSNNIYILLAAIGLFSMHILIVEHFRIREIVIFLALLAIFGINYIQTNDSRVLLLLVMIIAIRDVDLQTVLKIFFYVRLTLFVMTIGLAFWEVIPSIVLEHTRGRRYAMGFTHPNQFMAALCMLFMMYVCLYYKKINGTRLLALTAGMLAGYFISKSNTGLVTGAIILILLMLYKYFKAIKLLELSGKYLPSFLMLLSLFLPYTLRANVESLFFFRRFPEFAAKYEAVLKRLDTALSSRLTLSRLTLLNTDFSLFGSKTGTLQASYTLVDSGYVQLILVFGILGSILFLILNWFMLRELIERKQYIYIWAFIGLSLYAFTENTLCSLAYNFVLIFIAELFQSKKEDSYYPGRMNSVKKRRKFQI